MQDSVQCPEYLLLFNMIIGNTFFINRFLNMINAIRTTVQYTGYRWASFNSLVLLILCSPTHTSLSKHSVYTLESFVNIHSLVFSLEGRAWQKPEPSHVTGMALAHCILGTFLGVVCHCFPPFFVRLCQYMPQEGTQHREHMATGRNRIKATELA